MWRRALRVRGMSEVSWVEGWDVGGCVGLWEGRGWELGMDDGYDGLM